MKPVKAISTFASATHIVLPNHTNTLGNLMGGQLLNWLDVRKEQHCGEFVVLVAGLEKPDKQELSESDIKVLTVLLEELSIKQASHLAAKITKKKKNSLYKMALELSEKF